MNCPRCKKEMQEVKRHKFPERLKRQPYFYSRWWRCRCGFIKNDELAKHYPSEIPKVEKKQIVLL